MNSPRYVGPNICTLTEAETARVNRFIARVGSINRARKRLAIGEQTLDAARDCGRMQKVTRARLFAALDREEAIA